MMMKNCGTKFNINARSFHRYPTYTQPQAPISCTKLFQGVMPNVCNTMAHKIVTALAYLIYQT